MVRKPQKAKLLGVGLDQKDEAVRVTRSKDFHLVGGSQETHEVMQEKAIKFTEKLRHKGKELEELEHKEFLDLAAECKMNVMEIRKKQGNS